MSESSQSKIYTSKDPSLACFKDLSGPPPQEGSLTVHHKDEPEGRLGGSGS